VQFSFLPACGGRVGIHHFVGAVVPHNHVAGAVVPFRNHALEAAVIHRMIFGLDGEPLFGWVECRTFWNCPGTKHALHFQAEVVMKTGGAVFLNDETVALCLLDFTFGFGRLVKAALPFVLFKTHV
jgi:hypothetical protein